MQDLEKLIPPVSNFEVSLTEARVQDAVSSMQQLRRTGYQKICLPGPSLSEANQFAILFRKRGYYVTAPYSVPQVNVKPPTKYFFVDVHFRAPPQNLYERLESWFW